MPSTVQIETVPATERVRAEAIWRTLEARLEAVPVTASWTWTDTWLRHYGNVVPHRFAVGRTQGRTCGITLLCEDTRRRGPVRLRRLHLGTAGEPVGEDVSVERNGVLAEPEHRETFAARLLETLADEGGWSDLCLDAFSFEQALPFLEHEPRLEARLVPSRYLDLSDADGEVDSVLALLRSKTRSGIRRSLRELEPLTTEWPEEPAHKLDVFAELCELHGARWTARGEVGAFASDRRRAFHHDLIARGDGSTALFRVRSGDRTVACLYNLVEGADTLCWQAGIAPNPTAKRTSPGLAAHALFMAASAERGFRRYDFLAGESEYKRQLSSRNRVLVWARRRRAVARYLTPRWKRHVA
jgi:CelD/BcsL family acetyltransferase involved in cellulose biosynthesis